jgi:subtilisin family serine protease
LDLVAPGKDALSSGLIGPVYKSGTSMAAAHVTGLASLLRGISPLKSDQIEKTMKSTSKDLGTTGWDQYFGSGLIQVKNALKYLFNILFPPHRKNRQMSSRRR